MEEIIIREVTEADMPAVTDIYNHYIANSTSTFNIAKLSAAEMSERMRGIYPEFPYFVAEINGSIAGFCYAHPWKEKEAYRHTWETTIYIAPESTGKGLGESLMRRLISASAEKGCKVLIACITEGNDASIRLHEKLGFRQVSHFFKVGRKFDRYLDVLDYQLCLEP